MNKDLPAFFQNFRPMLAGKFDAKKQKYPCVGSGKIDGFRTIAIRGKAMSRSMKLLPNEHVQKMFAHHAKAISNMDGEIVVGEPNDPQVFENTSGPIRRSYGTPDFTFWVFDTVPELGDDGWTLRNAYIHKAELPSFVKIVPTRILHNEAELIAFEEEMLMAGFEGIMTRDPHGLYKQGRSTTLEGGLIKVKRRETCEVLVTGYEEEMHNANEATTNELGRTARSSHKDNKIGKGTLGAFLGTVLNGSMKGKKTSIGTGLTAADRAMFWKNRDKLNGSIVEMEFFPIGCQDAPRHPVFIRFRPKFDLDELTTEEMDNLLAEIAMKHAEQGEI